MDSHQIDVSCCVVCAKQIDVAVITDILETEVKKRTGNEHVVCLQKIPITAEMFKNLFYFNSNLFSLNQPGNLDASAIMQYAGLIYPYRLNCEGNNFCLTDTIFDNIEYDLGVTRDMFTPCSNISLNSELSGLTDLYKLSSVKIECSLTWSELLSVVKCELGPNDTSVTICLVISVVFITPTVGTNPTIIKLFYETTFTF